MKNTGLPSPGEHIGSIYKFSPHTAGSTHHQFLLFVSSCEKGKKKISFTPSPFTPQQEGLLACTLLLIGFSHKRKTKHLLFNLSSLRNRFTRSRAFV